MNTKLTNNERNTEQINNQQTKTQIKKLNKTWKYAPIQTNRQTKQHIIESIEPT